MVDAFHNDVKELRGSLVSALGMIFNQVQGLRRKYRIWKSGRIAEFDGLRIPLPKGVISDNMACTLLNGNYDQADRYFLKKYLKPNDYVLEIGGGCGVTAMIARRIVGDAGEVITVEPDPEMQSYAQRNFEKNNLKVECLQGVGVADRATKTVEFYKYADFWASQMTTDTGQHVEKLEVQGIYPPDLLGNVNDRRAVLICDVEGYETELLGNPEVIAPFSLILAEIHNYGWPSKAEGVACADMLHTIIDSGFRLVETAGQSFVFVRRDTEGS